MIYINHKIKNHKSGFALLMSLIVVGTVVSVGLTVLDITLKQLRLSTGSRDSESAFHAANAGAECMRYWRKQESDDFEAGLPVNMTCFNSTPINNLSPSVLVPGSVFKYEGQFNWVGNNRCTEFTIVTMNPDFTSEVVLNSVNTHVPGYPAVPSSKTCPVGGRCTIISVQGYNRSCAAPGNSYPIGTVQREVLLEL